MLLGVRLLVHNPLLCEDGVTKDDFPPARERAGAFLGIYTRTRRRRPAHPRKRSYPRLVHDWTCTRMSMSGWWHSAHGDLREAPFGCRRRPRGGIPSIESRSGESQ